MLNINLKEINKSKFRVQDNKIYYDKTLNFCIIASNIYLKLHKKVFETDNDDIINMGKELDDLVVENVTNLLVKTNPNEHVNFSLNNYTKYVNVEKDKEESCYYNVNFVPKIIQIKDKNLIILQVKKLELIQNEYYNTITLKKDTNNIKTKQVTDYHNNSSNKYNNMKSLVDKFSECVFD